MQYAIVKLNSQNVKRGIPMDNNLLGSRIARLREEKELSQLELAKMLNISNTTLSQYESGKRVPSDEIKKQMADFFDVSIDYLLGRTNIKELADKVLDRYGKYSASPPQTQNGPYEDLPPEAKKEMEKVMEFIRYKYGIK